MILLIRLPVLICFKVLTHLISLCNTKQQNTDTTNRHKKQRRSRHSGLTATDGENTNGPLTIELLQSVNYYTKK